MKTKSPLFKYPELRFGSQGVFIRSNRFPSCRQERKSRSCHFSQRRKRRFRRWGGTTQRVSFLCTNGRKRVRSFLIPGISIPPDI